MGGGGKKRKPVTVGYRYYWDIQSGLGRGPIDEIVEIRADDKTAYVGNPGELTHSQAIYINKPKLFGGEDTGGEGGIQGRMEILMGEPDQQPTQMLINLLKSGTSTTPPTRPNFGNSFIGRLAERMSSQGRGNNYKEPNAGDGSVAPGQVDKGDRFRCL